MHPPTCLIIDDSDVIRRVLRHMLGALGFDVSEAAGSQEALQRLARNMPDAVILDDTLPDATGLETLDALRHLPGGQAPVVLYCPIADDPDEAARARAAGANGVLPKPFNRAALQSALAGAGFR